MDAQLVRSCSVLDVLFRGFGAHMPCSRLHESRCQWRQACDPTHVQQFHDTATSALSWAFPAKECLCANAMLMLRSLLSRQARSRAHRKAQKYKPEAEALFALEEGSHDGSCAGCFINMS
jgi:hypothetical protein